MFDFVFGNSYIDTVYNGRLYLSESYEQLSKIMNDSSSTITVHVEDWTGLGPDIKTIKKSEITCYGPN